MMPSEWEMKRSPRVAEESVGEVDEAVAERTINSSWFI
jgi:hypothetical protein